MALNTRAKYSGDSKDNKIVSLPRPEFWKNYVPPTITDINPALGPVKSPIYTSSRKGYEVIRKRINYLETEEGLD